MFMCVLSYVLVCMNMPVCHESVCMYMCLCVCVCFFVSAWRDKMKRLDTFFIALSLMTSSQVIHWDTILSSQLGWESCKQQEYADLPLSLSAGLTGTHGHTWVVLRAFDLSTQEAEVSGSQWDPGQPGLHSETSSKEVKGAETRWHLLMCWIF